MKFNGIIKVAVVSLLGILGLWLISTLLLGTGGGVAYNTRGYYEGGQMSMNIAVGSGGAFAFILLLLIKVLFAVFVTTLVVGIIIWVKNNVFTKEDIETIKNTFKGNKTVSTKETCKACCKEMEASWKVCPHCGKAKEAVVKQTEVKQEEVKETINTEKNKTVEKK